MVSTDDIGLPQVVQAYFDTLNQKAFEQTARLFTKEGALVPPFEGAVVGREAIATYLSKEAIDLTLIPLQIDLASLETPSSKETPSLNGVDSLNAPLSTVTATKLTVTGKAKTAIFTVNVAWHFTLGSEDGSAGKIERVQVKLLAKITELMAIKR